MLNGIIVSICCLTYNHKEYIKQTLESFLNQKVKFNYEIIVHDDASTDGTTEILLEFQKKYSDIIKPIYQTVNQYSKGINIFEKYILPKAKGRYLAFCEGDDFWCDELKLQKQIDFLVQNEDYSACVHNTLIWDQETDDKNKKINEIDSSDQNITIERILDWDIGVPFHTSSVVCKKKIFEKELPKFFILPKCFGDFPMDLYMATEGKIYFFASIMSIYRSSVPNSYSNRTKDTGFWIKKESEKILMLKEFNCYSQYQYNDLIKGKLLKLEFGLNIYQKNFKKNLLPKYKKIRQHMKVQEKLKLYIKAYCIHIYRLYHLLKMKKSCY